MMARRGFMGARMMSLRECVRGNNHFLYMLSIVLTKYARGAWTTRRTQSVASIPARTPFVALKIPL